MVDADAAELHGNAVQEEAAVRIEPEGTDPHGNRTAVRHRSAGKHFALQGIQRGTVRAPEGGGGNAQFRGAAGPGRFRLRGGSAVPVQQAEADGVPAQGFILNPQQRLPGRSLRRGDEDAVRREAYGIRDLQEHMPVDSAAGIPAGIRRFRMVHPDRNHVLPGADEGADVKREACIPVGVHPQVIAVEPDLRMVVHALENNPDALSLHGFVQAQVLPVPGDAAGKIPGAAGMAPVEGILHGPVVGQGYGAPGTVVIAHEIRAFGVSVMKEPVPVDPGRSDI